MDAPTDDVAVAGFDSPVGRISVAATETGVVAVAWTDRNTLAQRSTLPVVTDAKRTAPVIEQLLDYLHGDRREFELPIDWRHTKGSQRIVLQTLFDRVRYGQSVTYGELARRSGTAVPARGIGAIMGSNPIPIVVPCHRVVAHDGLGGYSGGSNGNGLEVKRWLLTLEGVLPPTLDWNPASALP